MVKAYVNDAGQFLDLANKENVRILGGKTLIWINYKPNFLIIQLSTIISFRIDFTIAFNTLKYYSTKNDLSDSTNLNFNN